MDEEIMQTAENAADLVDDAAFEAGWNDEDTGPSAPAAGEAGREEDFWEDAAPGAAERQEEPAFAGYPRAESGSGQSRERETRLPAEGRAPFGENPVPIPVPGPGAGEAQRALGLNRFAMARPDVKAENIPGEVWQEFRSSGDLLGAYTRYENAQLRQRISALEQNQRNRERSAGSRRTAGAAQLKDIFDAAWDAFDD